MASSEYPGLGSLQLAAQPCMSTWHQRQGHPSLQDSSTKRQPLTVRRSLTLSFPRLTCPLQPAASAGAGALSPRGLNPSLAPENHPGAESGGVTAEGKLGEGQLSLAKKAESQQSYRLGAIHPTPLGRGKGKPRKLSQKWPSGTRGGECTPHMASAAHPAGLCQAHPRGHRTQQRT